MKFQKQLLTLGLVVLSQVVGAAKAHAWGALAHQTMGEIADRILTKEDPATKRRLEQILGVEPLAYASTFADEVKSDSRFNDFDPYHYTTYFRDRTQKKDRDALTVLEQYPVLLRVTNDQNRAQQVLALRYLVHVAQDVFQPLHAGNEFDQGANSCIVLFRHSNGRLERTNLHTVWDTDLVNEVAIPIRQAQARGGYFGYAQLASGLMEKYPEIVKEKPSTDVNLWIRETSELAKTAVYPDSLPEDKRPYCQKKSVGGPSSIPSLGPSYISKVSPIIEKQIVRGGVQLAAFLQLILKDRNGPFADDKAVLESLKLLNHKHP